MGLQGPAPHASEQLSGHGTSRLILRIVPESFFHDLRDHR
ncbi:MAG: hypothetical protein ACJAQ3_002383, partial [Planctomycetota bacterium]